MLIQIIQDEQPGPRAKGREGPLKRHAVLDRSASDMMAREMLDKTGLRRIDHIFSKRKAFVDGGRCPVGLGRSAVLRRLKRNFNC